MSVFQFVFNLIQIHFCKSLWPLRVLEYKALHTHQTGDVWQMFVTSGKYQSALWCAGDVWEMTEAFSDWHLGLVLFSYWFRPHEVGRPSSTWNHWFWWQEAPCYVQRLGFCVKKKKARMHCLHDTARRSPQLGTKVQIEKPCLCEVEKCTAAARLSLTETFSAGLKIPAMLMWLHCHFLKCCQ